ncbi:SixA phosphatase family protein [Sphingobacterium sp. Mn56C]|uniref:SixA phosphatase family protein n=1 Tax=Sphingobacterium sp. Mn56C TaxID=3395261 RepID=UPI003BD94BD5
MKRLYIIRHAKAEFPSLLKDDYDRNLMDKGIKRAQQIALDLKNRLKITANTLVISSTANRALQTAELFGTILGYPLENIQQQQSIYEAHYKTILEVINKVPNTVENLLVFGHNPGLSDLSNYICDTCIDLKTAHVACIELEEGLDFRELSGGTAHLKNILTA